MLAGDERLTTQRISELACRDLELVVSAACGSGRNRPAAVDEPVGLSRAWLLSGARVVLGMLWEVGDEASYRFMSVFYRRLHAGESHADAYWHAQRELLSGDAFDRDGRYWGAFALTSRTHPTSGRETA